MSKTATATTTTTVALTVAAETNPDSEVALIRPEGELSAADLRSVARYCFRQAQSGRPQVVLDLAAVEHLDYRGVSTLMSARKLLHAAGGDLKLAGMSTYVAAILNAAGAHAHFNCYPTAEEARRDFATLPARR